MSDPTAPVSPEVAEGIRTGDLPSLESLFRQRFPALMTEIQASLESGPGPAAHVIELAFARLWSMRSDFKDGAALEAALQKALADVALREKSRMASVHRMEKNEGPHATPKSAPSGAAPQADEVWAHIEQLVRPRAPRADGEQRAEQARHNAASHMSARVPKKNAWVTPVLGGLTVAVVIILGIWRLDKAGASLDIDKELSDPHLVETIAPDAQRGNMTLDDSSAIQLGPESHLGVPPGFNTKVRAVHLTGTAALKVFPGRKDSFNLRVGKNVALTATDATIEVRADSGQPIFVRVRAGQANAAVGKTHKLIGTGEALRIDSTGAMRPATPAEVDNAVGWTDGDFVADSEPLSVVVAEFRRWYALTLFVPDKHLLDRPVTMRASLSSQDQAIKALEKGGKLSFGYDPTGKNMQLSDGKK